MDRNTVGQKAFSLNQFRTFTPHYEVLSTEHFNEWRKRSSLGGSTQKILEDFCKHFQSVGVQKIIIRSSVTTENLEDRGKHTSLVCTADLNDLLKTVNDVYTEFDHSTDKKIALIIQEYKDPVVIGHASNERRLKKEEADWFIELKICRSGEIRSWELNVKSISKPDYSIIYARNLSKVRESLESFCSLLTTIDFRAHVEWIWDGLNFWIVQVDYEMNVNPGTPPASEFKMENFLDGPNLNENSFEILEVVENTKNKWHKNDCLTLFKELELPHWNIYTLEDFECIKNLQRGKIDIELQSDLKKLLVRPILIRTDLINVGRDVMSPRTETIHTLEEAMTYLVDTSKKFNNQNISIGNYCFLIHQFILSTSCALASAKPDFSSVRVDSNWGIVEGLYYHSCDSFEYNLSTDEVKSRIRCKSKYVDVKADGSWYQKDAGYSYDWKPSLINRQVQQIANFTKKIAEHLNRPVTVMYFINTSRRQGYPEIVPWYFGKEPPPEETKPIDEIFVSKVFHINNEKDFERLKSEKIDGQKLRIQLKIGLSEIRDYEFVKSIATYLKDKDCVVFINGSVLSHPYYILESEGLQVRCSDPLEATFKTKEFYKLVRDKIPVYIMSKNEQVNSEKLPPQRLLELLKIKVVEEALELYWEENNDNVIEEMADVYEVLLGLCKVHGIDFSAVQKIANDKKELRGGFEEGVFLIATKEKSLVKIGQDNELFLKSTIDNSLRKRSINKTFKIGNVDKLRSLNEVDEIRIPYLHPTKIKEDPVRFLLKEDIGDLLSVRYTEDEIILKFSDLDVNDPDQMDLFEI